MTHIAYQKQKGERTWCFVQTVARRCLKKQIFDMRCGKPLTSASSAETDSKIINIPRSLLRQCLNENFKNAHEHPWSFGSHRQLWIQFDPETGRCQELVVDKTANLQNKLVNLNPGWKYYFIPTATEEWEIEDYLNSPPRVEFTMGEYKGRFI